MTQQAKDTSTRVVREAEEGGATVQKSISALSRVRDSMSQSAQVIREMGKRTGDISTIVDTIDMIAERTNLLSLNASIEAARAGEAGRGFAVVAEEIRNLADRSAKATSDIAAIIKALQEVVQEAVATSNDGLRVADESGRMSEDAVAALKKILGGVHETTQLIAQIATASAEQLAAAQNAATAINTTSTQAKHVATATAEQSKAVRQVLDSAIQIRKRSAQVSQAVMEQSAAAREVMKAAQATTGIASQIRNAAKEQAKAAEQIVQAIHDMRRVATNTSKALVEQSTAVNQVSQEAGRLAGSTARINKSMGEQAQAVAEISKAVEDSRKQSEQLARVMVEQTRAIKEMTSAAHNISKQISFITRSNKEHSGIALAVLESLHEIRRVTAQNSEGAKNTLRGTKNLLDTVEALVADMEDLNGNGSTGKRRRSNGA
jgi:methyl-accepting chemotaxis protein